MFDRLILNEELVGCRGEVIAARGTVLSLEAVAEVARRTPALPRRSLEETPLAADAEVPLDAPVYRHLFDGEGVRDTVRRALLAIRLPAALFEELLALRRAASPLHAHAFATAAVAVRMLLSAVGERAASRSSRPRRSSTTSACAICRRVCCGSASGSGATTRSAWRRTRSSVRTTSRSCSARTRRSPPPSRTTGVAGRATRPSA